jgi:hypothetical protein
VIVNCYVQRASKERAGSRLLGAVLQRGVALYPRWSLRRSRSASMAPDGILSADLDGTAPGFD